MSSRGNIVVSLLFVLLLSVSGLALLSHSDLHGKIIAARQGKWRAAAALEQGVLLALHRYREKLAAADINAYPAPEIDFFNDVVFPEQRAESCLCRSFFSHVTLRDEEGFRLVRVLNRIEARQDGGRLRAAGQAGVDLLAGNIPANEFALVVNREIAEDPAAFLAARGLEYAGAQLPLVGKLAVSSSTGRLLADALGLGGPLPDWRRIREKFNLEPGDGPIPAGIYLAQDGEEVTAVFVEGDLQKLEFGAGDGWQSVSFLQNGLRSELRYRPGLASLSWSGPDPAAGRLFSEKIIVHGNVWDIGQAGAAAFLSASRLQVLACGQMIVRSQLEGGNLELGKEKLPGLLLMTAGRDFFNDREVRADIVLDMRGEKTVQAQVLAAGALVNGPGTVRISGGLYAGDIQNAGRLRVDAAAGRFAFDRYVVLPDFKFLKNFRVHYIQEGNDE